VRFPGVPGPRDLLALVERTGEIVDQLIGAVPRMTALLEAAERVVGDIGELVAGIDETRVAADTVMARIDAAATSVDALLVTAAAAEARLADLLDRLEPSLTALQPTLARLAETTDPREVDALVGLIDRLPVLAEQVERDVVPVMRTLSSVSPDLHDLLDVSRELNEMLARLPGMGRIKRRVDAEQARGELTP
jgi:ABC-type transporter Mla subunit MlaD